MVLELLEWLCDQRNPETLMGLLLAVRRMVLSRLVELPVAASSLWRLGCPRSATTALETYDVAIGCASAQSWAEGPGDEHCGTAPCSEHRPAVLSASLPRGVGREHTAPSPRPSPGPSVPLPPSSALSIYKGYLPFSGSLLCVSVVSHITEIMWY